ncbi:MAG: hypothetical protein AB1489_06485 [Acidobacteriota bacterium]
MSIDAEKKRPKRLFPVMCGLMIGAMPTMLWLPIMNGLMRWLLGNIYFLLFYLFMNYLPLIIGSLIGRMIGLPIFVPLVFCLAYWLFLGACVGNPEYKKPALFYIFIAHILVPLVLLLNVIKGNNSLDFLSYQIMEFVTNFQ